MWKCKLCEINNDDIRNSCIICGTGAAESRKYWEILAAENSRRNPAATAPGRPPVRGPMRNVPPPPPGPRYGSYGARPAPPLKPPPTLMPHIRDTIKPPPPMRKGPDIKPEKKGRGVVVWAGILLLSIIITVLIICFVTSNNDNTTSTQAFDEQYSTLYFETLSAESEYIIDFSDNYTEKNFLPPEDVKICFA